MNEALEKFVMDHFQITDKEKAKEKWESLEKSEQLALAISHSNTVSANLQKSLDEQIEKAESEKEAHAALIAKQTSELKELTKSVNTLYAEIEAKSEGKTQDNNKKDTLEGQLKANKEAIKALMPGDQKEVVVKAMTNRASVTDNENATTLSEIGQLAHRRLTLYDFATKIRVNDNNNNGVIRYYDWDEATITRAAAMVAEGATFPESTAKWKEYQATFKKIGDTIPVTEEMLEDSEMFAAELEVFLQTNVELVISDQLTNGDGTGQNLTGLLNLSTPYTATASAIQDASIYDLIVKMREDITVPYGSKFSPNMISANTNTINRMKLKKDANDNYIMPPFVSRDGQVIDQMTVLENNDMANNEIVVGDSRFMRIYEKTGIVISRGQIDANFIEDTMMIKARKRMLFLIRNCDQKGFLHCDDIDAALLILAS